MNDNSENIKTTIDYAEDSVFFDEISKIKHYHPIGIETANYYSYYDFSKVKIHFNKHFQDSIIDNHQAAIDAYGDPIENYQSADDYKYDSGLEDDTEETSLSVSETFKLDTTPYKIEHALKLTDIKKILNNNENINHNVIIISPPNTRKTSNVKKHLINKGQKFIFLAPLRFQVQQMSNDKKLFAVKGGDKFDLTQKIKEHKFIITTYEYFKKLDELIRDKWNYYLVIDEYHKLISDSGFRTEALAYIYDNMFKYAKFIGLTGTPYGCINTSLLRQNVKLIEIHNENKNKLIKDEYNIIQYIQHDNYGHSDFSIFYHYIKKNISAGINVVFANNKYLLKENKIKVVS